MRRWSYIYFQFLENAITDENLSDLTPELIKEMIPKIGLRMEFLKKWMAVFKTELDVSTHIYVYVEKRILFYIS